MILRKQNGFCQKRPPLFEPFFHSGASVQKRKEKTVTILQIPFEKEFSSVKYCFNVTPT